MALPSLRRKLMGTLLAMPSWRMASRTALRSAALCQMPMSSAVRPSTSELLQPVRLSNALLTMA